MDKIQVQGLRLYAYHGVNPEEKENGQPFVLDITAHKDVRRAGRTDDLNDTVSYAALAKTAAAVFVAEKNDLLERAATRVTEALLEAFPIEQVTVCVKKPQAPIALEFDTVAVEITRRRED